MLTEINKDSNLLIAALKQHNIKDCQKPFAIKMMAAINDLLYNTSAYDYQSRLNIKIKLTEKEEKQAFLTLVDGLSKINNSGLSVNDHELIYFVKRSKSLTVMTHYLAPFRVAKRAGYMIVPTFYEVYQNEEFEVDEVRDAENKILYNIKHKKLEFDRNINIEKLVKNNVFKGFALRLSVSIIHSDGKIEFLFEAFTSMTPQEIIDRSNRGDNGIYLSRWETKKDGSGKKEKVITDIINKNSIWYSDTKAMVYKTLIREITRPLREALPKLEKMYEFMDYEEEQELKSQETPLDKASNTVDATFTEQKDIDLKNPSEDLKKDVNELLQIYEVNPQLAEQHLKDISILLIEANELKNNSERKTAKQKIINTKAKFILALNAHDEKYKTELGKLFKGSK